jgi:hypothetical protein
MLRVTTRLIVLVLICCVIYACNKSNIDVPAKAKTQSVNIINVLPDTTKVINFYSYGTRQNINSLGYLSSTGPASVNVPLSASIKDANNLSSISTPIGLITIDTTSTLFITSKNSKDTVVLAVDTTKADVSVTTLGKAKVRFVNVSPGLSPVLITINNTTLTSTPFGSVSSFVRVDTGVLKLKIPGVNFAVPKITLTSQGVYTFFSYGLNTNKVPFGVRLIQNH